MISAILISQCCGKGYQYLSKLYTRLQEQGCQIGIGGTNFDTGLTICKQWNLNKEDCPRIIIEELGLSFKAEDIDNEEFFCNLVKTIKDKSITIK